MRLERNRELKPPASFRLRRLTGLPKPSSIAHRDNLLRIATCFASTFTSSYQQRRSGAAMTDRIAQLCLRDSASKKRDVQSKKICRTKTIPST
jgi:hypothetical protein